ncbi:MAG: PorT family protein [Cyclobacteriaceae bacterium]|nr:PorT family protein [Cyclobacteriaceae bacterium]
MKKLFYSVSFFFLATVAVIAQPTFGIKAGFNFAIWSQNFQVAADEMPVNSRLAPNLGLVVDYPISEGLSLRSGIQYSSKGTAVDLKELLADLPDLKIKGYDRFIVNYLEIPVKGVFAAGPVKVSAGPYFAFGLNGINKWDYEVTYNGGSFTDNGSEKAEFSNERISGNNKWEIKGMDLGIDLGVEYPVGPVSLGLSYSKGFVNMTPSDPQDPSYDPSTEKMTNSVFSFTAIYMLSK